MIYLIDSSIYIFRAWQTLPASITNSFGEPANAVFGFADTLASIIDSEKPSHMVAAFDHSHGSGERYSIYPDYKADRPPAPEDLQIQFNRCFEVATAMGLAAFGSKRVEADDIIGSFAKLAHEQNSAVTIISADKDLTQFIRDGDVYWNFARKLRQSSKDIEKRFKIRPDQIADMLAICGDKVDCIPGVPGVGQTTAARLLKKWQTIDTLLDNLGSVADMQFRGAPRVAMLLSEHKDNIAIARQLTGLIHDPSLPDKIENLERTSLSQDDVCNNLIAIGFNEQRASRLASQVC